MNTKTTKPPTTPTPQPNSLPEWRPMDAQEEFEEENEQLMNQALDESRALLEPSNDPAHESLTRHREAIFGRPLTPAETEMLDETGLG